MSKLITTTLLLGGILGVGATLFSQEEGVVLENPQAIVWNKPTTDEQWAEDVKEESFHIKSTGILEEMRETHLNKIEKINNLERKLIDCPECIRYELKEFHPDWSQEEIESEYQDRLWRYHRDIEKLTQSIERMDNELRLREKGFVIVEDRVRNGFLGNIVNDKYIRKIND